jgi:hypothetical protein
MAPFPPSASLSGSSPCPAQFLTRMGVFGGSNALWKTETLRKYMFRHDVQTEDIELSVRVLLGDIKIRFCPESRSGELPPKSFKALWRQRLRWEIGWDQVTMQHFRDIRKSSLSCRKKASLYYWLPWRWLMLVTAAINAFVTPLFSLILSTQSETLGPYNQIMMNYSIGTYGVITLFIFANASLMAKRADIPYIVAFQLGSSLYLLWNALIVGTSLFRILTGRVDSQGFVPTERGGSENKAAAAAAAAAASAAATTAGSAMPLVPERTPPTVVASSAEGATTSEVRITVEPPAPPDKPRHKRTGPAKKGHRRTGSGTPLFQPSSGEEDDDEDRRRSQPPARRIPSQSPSQSCEGLQADVEGQLHTIAEASPDRRSSSARHSFTDPAAGATVVATAAAAAVVGSSSSDETAARVRAASHFGFYFGAREAENEEAIEYEEPPSGHEQGLNTADE